MEADRAAFGVQGGKRAGRAADRLWTALERGLGIVVSGQIQDQERSLGSLGLGG